MMKKRWQRSEQHQCNWSCSHLNLAETLLCKHPFENQCKNYSISIGLPSPFIPLLSLSKTYYFPFPNSSIFYLSAPDRLLSPLSSLSHTRFCTLSTDVLHFLSSLCTLLALLFPSLKFFFPLPPFTFNPRQQISQSNYHGIYSTIPGVIVVYQI